MNASSITFENIPAALTQTDQWVMWSLIDRNGTYTKTPRTTTSMFAKVNDPKTWTTFTKARDASKNSTFEGIGFVFSQHDSFIGIDLDGCRHPETGEVSPWALEIIARFKSYCEVSPSRTGVKIFAMGKWPSGVRHKAMLINQVKISAKAPAVEVYDKSRFFTVTGWKLPGCDNVRAEISALNWLLETYFQAPTSHSQQMLVVDSNADVINRARRYLAKLPPAIAGQGGHNATFRAACVLVQKFNLGPSDALKLMQEYNERCEPPWKKKDLLHKVKDAAKGTANREHLLEPIKSTLDTNPITRRQELKAEERAEGYSFSLVSSTQLDSTDYHPQWLVNRLLVAQQPAILGGPKKSLKTSILIDLALSLSTATAFLGKFDVPAAVKVAVLSGESGAHTIQETARRVCQAKSISLSSVNVHWSFELPQLANIAHLQELREGLEREKVRVVILDPLYLSLLANVGEHKLSAANLFDMGPLLHRVTRACVDIGCTPVLVHHTRKNPVSSYEPIDLEDLSFAGSQEFARQWMLISRREKYQPDTGKHQLWISAGGSIGHGGCWAVDIEEGRLNEDFSGRHWQVQVNTEREAEAAKKRQVNEKKAMKIHEREDIDNKKVLEAIDKMAGKDGIAGHTKVRSETRLSSTRLEAVIHRLAEAKKIEEAPFRASVGNGAQRESRGLRRRVEDGP